jgi:hypothetical protein
MITAAPLSSSHDIHTASVATEILGRLFRNAFPGQLT